MRLQEAEVIKLLPSWMRDDETIKALAVGTDAVTRALANKIILLSRWDKIDQLSEAELDEMAWELNIKWYNSTAPIEAKRATIKNSDLVYSKLGTPYAVEQMLSDYFGKCEIREWFDYGGEPHHFKILSNDPDMVGVDLDLFEKLIKTVMRRSSRLDAVLISLTGETTAYAGMAVHEYTEEKHVIYGEDTDSNMLGELILGRGVLE